MVDLLAASPLAGIAAGRHGVAGPAGLQLTEWRGLQLVSLAARRGRQDALIAAARAAYSLDLPRTPRWIGDARLGFLWSGPGQWLALAGEHPDDLEAVLRETLGAHASLADQGAGRIVLRLSGPQARAALTKLTAIDLHPRAFGPGDTALTLMAHIGVQLWQIDAQPSYAIAAFRGYARSLHHALLQAGAEYGVEMR